MEEKSNLYIVAVVGIVAIVALIILTIDTNRPVSTGTTTDFTGGADAVVKDFSVGSCEYVDGLTTGCPCANPSYGVLDQGSILLHDYCK